MYNTPKNCKWSLSCLFRILEDACVQFAFQSFVLLPLGLNHKVQPAKLVSQRTQQALILHHDYNSIVTADWRLTKISWVRVTE